MRKHIFFFSVVSLTLILLMNTAFAAGVLTVTQERFLVIPKDTYYSGKIFVEVTNTGDATAQFSGGTFALYNAKGAVIGSRDLSGYCIPSVLEPGEIGLFWARIDVEEAKKPDYIADYSLEISGQDQITDSIYRLPVTASFKNITDSASEYSYKIRGLILNDTDEEVLTWYTIFSLKDEAGTLLYVSPWSYDGRPAGKGIKPDDTTEMNMDMLSSDTSTSVYFDDDHIPASAEFIAFYFVD